MEVPVSAPQHPTSVPVTLDVGGRPMTADMDRRMTAQLEAEAKIRDREQRKAARRALEIQEHLNADLEWAQVFERDGRRVSACNELRFARLHALELAAVLAIFEVNR
jgi:hypothetical protein